MADRTPGDTNIYPCVKYPEASPDAIESKVAQRSASTIMNNVYNYESVTGKAYKFASNQDYIAFKLAKIRQGNILSGAYPSATQQSTITDMSVNLPHFK